jgi:hypothetical protein
MISHNHTAMVFAMPVGFGFRLAVTAVVGGITGTVIVDNFTLGITYSYPSSQLLLGVGG